MREIGTMWQIGVLAAERRVFFGKKIAIFGRFALRFKREIFRGDCAQMVGFVVGLLRLQKTRKILNL